MPIFSSVCQTAILPWGYAHEVLKLESAVWSVGLRAVYFATTLLLLIFGPIPTFVSSVSMVGTFQILDTNATPAHRF